MLNLFPLLRFADFRIDTSTYITDPGTDSYSGDSARAVNDPIQANSQAPNPVSAGLKLYGREMKYDDLYKMDTKVAGAPSLFSKFADRKLSGLARVLGGEVASEMVAGNATGNRMLGLKNFVLDAEAAGQTTRLGFTAAQLAGMNVQADMRLTISNEEDLRSFDELLRKEIKNVPGANGILCNTSLAARLGSMAKKLGSAGESVDSFGKPVTTYDGRPIIEVPDTALTLDETDGVNEDCTSLIIVRFAEEEGVTFSTNSGFLFTDFPDDVVNPDEKARLQFFLNLTVETLDSYRRVSRIRL